MRGYGTTSELFGKEAQPQDRLQAEVNIVQFLRIDLTGGRHASVHRKPSLDDGNCYCDAAVYALLRGISAGCEGRSGARASDRIVVLWDRSNHPRNQ